MGTGYYGSLAAEPTEESSGDSTGDEDDPFEVMTSEEAREIAERMKRGEG